MTDEQIHEYFCSLIEDIMDGKCKESTKGYKTAYNTYKEFRFRITISHIKIEIQMYNFYTSQMLINICFDKEREMYEGESRSLDFAKHHIDNIRLLETLGQID